MHKTNKIRKICSDEFSSRLEKALNCPNMVDRENIKRKES